MEEWKVGVAIILVPHLFLQRCFSQPQAEMSPLTYAVVR